MMNDDFYDSNLYDDYGYENLYDEDDVFNKYRDFYEFKNAFQNILKLKRSTNKDRRMMHYTIVRFHIIS